MTRKPLVLIVTELCPAQSATATLTWRCTRLDGHQGPHVWRTAI